MVQLIGNSRKYASHTENGDLPRTLNQFKNAISWPIKVSEPPFHLACYFQERNYSLPTFNRPHRGIDIQTHAGVPIVAPEKSRVVACHPNADNYLANFSLLGEESKIEHGFIHVDPDSIPEKIRNRTQVDPDQEDIIIEFGEYIGRIGTWPLDLSDLVNVPEDVLKEFGRSFHHLHLEMCYLPYDMFSMDYLHAGMNGKNLVNPLSLLQRLE
ncbi:hypothetical protein ACFL0X_01355 [Nanoarchaeota archaeon]